jgi:hypothetical protein
MADRIYTWFVEPLDGHTNEVIAKEAAARGVADEDFMCNILCSDNKRRDLWRLPTDLVKYLWESRETHHLRIECFSIEGKGRKPRKCTFLYQKKLKGKKIPKKKNPAKSLTKS